MIPMLVYLFIFDFSNQCSTVEGFALQEEPQGSHPGALRVEIVMSKNLWTWVCNQISAFTPKSWQRGGFCLCLLDGISRYSCPDDYFI